MEEDRDYDSAVSPLFDLVTSLRDDCNLGKYKHFSAADRAKRWNYVVGWPTIAIGLLLASGLFADVFATAKLRLIGSGLGFLSVVLVSLQTSFRFGKIQEGQRSIANRYLSIGRRANVLLGRLSENETDLGGGYSEFEGLHDEYLKTNTEAEAFPTSSGDFRRARKLRDEKIT